MESEHLEDTHPRQNFFFFVRDEKKKKKKKNSLFFFHHHHNTQEEEESSQSVCFFSPTIERARGERALEEREREREKVNLACCIL